MTNNKKFIVFFSVCSAIALLLAYTFSRIELNCKVISSNFVFVITSGIFASFVVVLITEIKKYYENKRAIEDSLYNALCNLYTELTNEIKTTEMYLKNKIECVPETLYNDSMHTISNLSSFIKNLDYSTFKATPLFNSFKILKNDYIGKIDKHISYCNYLKMAILKTKIEALKAGTQAYNPTASDHFVELALRKISTDADVKRQMVEGLINSIITQYPKRYNWLTYKANIDSVPFDMEELKKQGEEFFEEK